MEDDSFENNELVVDEDQVMNMNMDIDMDHSIDNEEEYEGEDEDAKREDEGEREEDDDDGREEDEDGKGEGDDDDDDDDDDGDDDDEDEEEEDDDDDDEVDEAKSQNKAQDQSSPTVQVAAKDAEMDDADIKMENADTKIKTKEEEGSAQRDEGDTQRDEVTVIGEADVDVDVDAEVEADEAEKLKQEEEQRLSKLSHLERVILKAKAATEFDIVPSVAFPYSGQCHSIALSDGPQWILTGGEDGFIRKYDFIASIQGKSPLTVAQKHNLVDSVTKAGVISSYWENEQPITKSELLKMNPKIKASDFNTGSISYEPKINPVYSLDVERHGYWCISGLLLGGISLYTMRYNEGQMHHIFAQDSKANPKGSGHTDAVSVVTLNQSQNAFLSGSWDKTIRLWDLNTGKTNTIYKGSSGQITNVKFRPDGLTDLDISLPGDDDNEEVNGDEDDIDSLFGDSDKDEDNNNKEAKDRDNDPKRVKDTSKTTSKTLTNENIFMTSSIDGTVNIWDVRQEDPVIKFGIPEGVPPWCMSAMWSNNGDNVYVGRRNSTIEEINLRMPHARIKNKGSLMAPNVAKTLQFPRISGPVSAMTTMPNDNFILCGSMDNIRLYNLELYGDNANNTHTKKHATPFLIIPGHQGGILSNLKVDPSGRFLISASGNRGWGHAAYAETVLVYEIDFEM